MELALDCEWRSMGISGGRARPPPLGGMHVLDGYLSGAHLCAVHTGPVGRLLGRVVGDVGTGWGPVSGRS